MAHDAKGNALKPGDEVIVRCRVLGIYSSEDYCNVTLETVNPLYPGVYRPEMVLNTRQLELVSPEAELPMAA